MEENEIDRIKTEVEKDMEDILINKVDEALGNKLNELEDRINQVDLEVQNFLKKDEPEEEIKQENINREIFQRLNKLEDEVNKMRKVLENISYSSPTVVD